MGRRLAPWHASLTTALSCQAGLDKVGGTLITNDGSTVPDEYKQGLAHACKVAETRSAQHCRFDQPTCDYDPNYIGYKGNVGVLLYGEPNTALIDLWMLAPFHATGLLRKHLTKVDLYVCRLGMFASRELGRLCSLTKAQLPARSLNLRKSGLWAGCWTS